MGKSLMLTGIRNLVYLCHVNLAEQWSYLMATIEQFESAIAAINEATNAVAAEVAALKAIIAGGGLSPEQEAVVLQSLTDIEANLKAIAAPQPPIA